jgi:hypothetical protein
LKRVSRTPINPTGLTPTPTEVLLFDVFVTWVDPSGLLYVRVDEEEDFHFFSTFVWDAATPRPIVARSDAIRR